MKDFRQQEVGPAEGANPFFHRGAIRDPSYFYGRSRETSLLMDLVHAGESASVVGQRRIGKTSLLLHIADPGVPRAGGSDHLSDFAYLSWEGREHLTEAQVLRLLLRAAPPGAATTHGSRTGSYAEEEITLDDLEDALSGRMGTERRLVYLFDEFEGLAGNPNLGPAFFSALRRMAMELRVSYVTVSRQSLMTLTTVKGSSLSSPFFNFLHTLRLGLLTDEESVALIQGLAGRGGLRFPEPLLEFVLDLAGAHPFFLQLAGFQAFELLSSANGALREDDYALMRQRFWTTAEQHMRYYWSHLDGEERYVLATLPQQSDAGNDVFSRLEEDCLIVRSGGRYRYASAAVRDFVRSQQVEGLAQSGRFVVDLQRQAVVMDEASVELTPIEYRLLAYLIERPGEVATYDQLEQHVWGDDYSGDPERLKAAIKHLRRALGSGAQHIENVRGVGYMLQP